MAILITEEDKIKIKTIYQEVMSMTANLKDLDQMKALLDQAIQLAENYGQDNNELLSNLLDTRTNQLTVVMKAPVARKLIALQDLRLFIMGDLIGWF